MDTETLAVRRFEMADQERFAAFCGDRNPMHMDAVAARRTQAGACAVHGVHGVLWALERLAEEGAPISMLAALRADFARFIAVGQSVTLVVTERTPARLRAELRVEGARATALDLRFGPRRAAAEPVATVAPERPVQPADRDFDAIDGLSGRIAAPPGSALAAEELFPSACAALGTEQVTTIGLASTLVGMAVPGLHSIFSNLRLTFTEMSDAQGLGYSVQRADERFRLVTLAVEGPGFLGSVAAFLRYPPVPAPSLARLATEVASKEFASRRALVIGGSRGLGAVTAKLIAAGGGHVALTYRSGRSEAEAIRDEITGAFGRESCTIARFDAATDVAAQLAELEGPFTHLYYFATGQIFGGADGFDAAALEGHMEVYVLGFARLADYVSSRLAGETLDLFYPSTVAVEARPRGLTEYAMAKAAGEILCSELPRGRPQIVVTAPRLPRVLTDQTATVPPVPAEDPVAVMLPLLRAERG